MSTPARAPGGRRSTLPALYDWRYRIGKLGGPRAARSLRIELGRVLQLAQDAPHLLDDLHLVDGNGQAVGCRAQRFDGLLASGFGSGALQLARGAARFCRFPRALALLADSFERLPLGIAGEA